MQSNRRCRPTCCPTTDLRTSFNADQAATRYDPDTGNRSRVEMAIATSLAWGNTHFEPHYRSQQARGIGPLAATALHH